MNIDVNHIRQACQSHPATEHVLRVLSARGRIAESTDLDRIRTELKENGVKVSREDVVNVFRVFQKMGWGRVVLNPLPLHNQFKWSGEVDSRVLRQWAVAAPETRYVPQPSVPPATHVPGTGQPLSSQTITIKLRPDVRVRIQGIPMDLSRSEVQEILSELTALASG